MRIFQLRPILESCWSADTTWSPETYEGKDPAWGQCGVTTMFMHIHYECHMMSGTAVFPNGQKTRHFWTMVGTTDLDFTARQFPIATTIESAHLIDLKGISQNVWFVDRYTLFEKRVLEKLN